MEVGIPQVIRDIGAVSLIIQLYKVEVMVEHNLNRVHVRLFGIDYW